MSYEGDQEMKSCSTCGGAGKVACPECGGSGKKPCPDCGGMGTVLGVPCKTCSMSGKLDCVRMVKCTNPKCPYV